MLRVRCRVCRLSLRVHRPHHVLRPRPRADVQGPPTGHLVTSAVPYAAAAADTVSVTLHTAHDLANFNRFSNHGVSDNRFSKYGVSDGFPER